MFCSDFQNIIPQGMETRRNFKKNLRRGHECPSKSLWISDRNFYLSAFCFNFFIDFWTFLDENLKSGARSGTILSDLWFSRRELIERNVFGILPDSELKRTRPALFHAPVDFEFSDKSKYQYNQAQIIVDRTLGHRRLGAIGASIKGWSDQRLTYHWNC